MYCLLKCHTYARVVWWCIQLAFPAISLDTFLLRRAVVHTNSARQLISWQRWSMKLKTSFIVVCVSLLPFALLIGLQGPSRCTGEQGEITGLLVQYWKLSLHSVLCTHIMSSSYRSNRFAFVSLRSLHCALCLDAYVFCVLLYFTACMLYYCNTVGWPGGIEAWSDDWPFSFSALTLLVGSHDL